MPPSEEICMMDAPGHQTCNTPLTFHLLRKGWQSSRSHRALKNSLPIRNLKRAGRIYKTYTWMNSYSMCDPGALNLRHSYIVYALFSDSFCVICDTRLVTNPYAAKNQTLIKNISLKNPDSFQEISCWTSNKNKLLLLHSASVTLI